MEAVPHMRKLVLAGGIAVLATVGTTTAAYGKGCSGSSSNPPSSVSQYVEQVPTSCGSKATGGSSNTRAVPKQLQQKIDSQGGSQAALITKIVSSGAYGAPDTKIKVTVVKGKGNTSKILSDSEARKRSNPFTASFGVITGGSDGRLIALLVLMASVAAIVIVSALRRRRVTR